MNQHTDRDPAVTNVAIYVFDEVEVLDFAGPFEVFSTASRLHRRSGGSTPAPFNVFVIAEQGHPVRARGSLMVGAHASFADHPPIDLLIIPGGDVSLELQRSQVVAWIAATASNASVTASICTGAFLLAAAGLLQGRRVTTHWEDLDDLRRGFPQVMVEAGPRWIDEGDLVTSAGISAGIDMSLHLVARLVSPEFAARTARQMDYAWQPNPEIRVGDRDLESSSRSPQ